MSKEKGEDYLKFGQGILIRGDKEKEGFGFLTAKGYADTKARYESIGTAKNMLYFKNYRDAIFEILPASSFEINDELRKKIESLKLEGILAPNGELLPPSPSDTEKETIKRKTALAEKGILEERSKSEKAQFELTIDKRRGDFITFGSTVILRHFDSKTYLTGTIRPSDGSNGAFSVEVTKNLSTRLIFKL